MIKFAMLLASITLAVGASTLLKIGGRAIDFGGTLPAIACGFLSSPAIVAGFACYALAALLWVYCLTVFDLSYVSFVASLQYVMLLAVSILVFQEQISLMKWAGCAFILIGVFCWLRG
jgi:drug/metabolite transporter (DMT)-like permease